MTILRRAIDSISAVRVARTAYAYYDDATQEWWVVDSRDLRDLGMRMQRASRAEAAGHYPDGDDTYDAWCGDTFARRATMAERYRAEAL